MKRYIHIIVFILLTTNTFAQFNTLRFGNFNSRNGLSSDYINDQVIDRNGYLWLATWDGLCRFDGKHWKIYKHIDGDSTSIPSSGINTLFVDVKGDVWIGTDIGICIYNSIYDNFAVPKFTLPSRSNRERTYSISSLPQKNILLICSNNGPYLYNLTTKQFFLINANPNHEVNYFPAVCHYSLGQYIYFGTAGKGLWYYDTLCRTMHHVNNGSNAFFDKDMMMILSFVEIDERTIYIATSAGLVVYDFYEKKIMRIIDNNCIINNLFVDKNKKLWVSKINEPLKVLDLVTKKEESLSFFFANNQKMRYNTATRITEDSLGNLWIGTHGNGVFYLDKYFNKFRCYSANSPLQQGLQCDIISCFFEQQNGRMWVGTDGGGLHLFDRETNTFTQYDLFKSKAILDIKPAQGDKLWIASYGGGLSLFDVQNKSVKTYIRDNDSNSNTVPANEIRYICQKNDSTIFLAGIGSGIGIFNPRTETFKTMLNDSTLSRAFDTNRWCNHILCDENGREWFSTSYGIVLHSNNQYYYYHSEDSANTISDNIVNFIFQDSKKRIFIGTNGGLDLWNEKTQDFTRLKTILPLSGNFKSVLEDLYGNLWFGTNSGIIKIDGDLKQIQTYNEFDGLQGNQFFLRSAYKTKDNLMFFGGLSGFNIIDPRNFSHSFPQTPIVFTDFQVLNKTQLPLQKGSILLKDINHTDTVRLEYNQSMIGFEFINLDILGVGKIQYQYRLINFSNQWFDADPSNKITYTNLDPGYYTLEIRSSNRFGSWENPSTKRITIHVLTPWWKTWWFRLGILAFIGLIIGYEFNRYRNQNKILTQMVKERTQELEEYTEELIVQNTITQEQREELYTKNQEIQAQKNYIESQNIDLQSSNEKLMQSLKTKDKFMSIIGHDLKNPISAIIGISELACASFDKYSDQKKLLFYKTIHSSATSVFELLESLLLWARTQTGNVEYKPELFKVQEVVKQVYDLLHDSASKKQIEIICTVDETCGIFADKNMLNTVVRNLVSNAIKFTPREGTITIDVHRTRLSTVKFTIQDTGQGMTEEQISSLFLIGKTRSTAGTENETGTGLGLILCSEFLKMHNSKLSVESEIEKGTIFCFEMESA